MSFWRINTSRIRHTIFRGIQKLPPAHYAVYRGGQLQVGCYWKPDFSPRGDSFRRRLSGRTAGDPPAPSKNACKVSVRWGRFCRRDSFINRGGARAAADARAGEDLLDRFSHRRVRRTCYAREVARHLGTDHHEERVELDCVKILPSSSGTTTNLLATARPFRLITYRK